MNTRKQVLVMSALLLMSLILIGIYGAWYPGRASNAETDFENARAERAAITFARNCRLCHGDVGEGGLAGARLPAAPPLARPDLQGFIDAKASLAANITATDTSVRVDDASGLKVDQIILIDSERLDVTGIAGNNLTVERGVGHSEPSAHSSGTAISKFDKATLTDKIEPLITNTITCGRVGTAMPAWGQSQGGPLSDEQITQLMTLITQGRWDLVKAEDDKEDRLASHLLEPVTADALNIKVSDVTVFNVKDAIRIGDERMRITAVPELKKNAKGELPKDKSGLVEVQRGVLGTTPLEHSVDEQIYKFPETSEPSVNQSSCGQTAKAPAPQGTPSQKDFPAGQSGQTLEISASNIQFSTKTLTAKTGGLIRVRFSNQDNGVPHNFAVYKSSSDITPVADGSVSVTFPGPAVDDIIFTAPAPGNYYFRCDVHPTLMFGTFTVTP